MNKKVIIFGGTFSHVRTHLALAAPAFGTTAASQIALALSLPNEPYKNVFVGVTFIVVMFSVLVQGFTMGKFVRSLNS
jgi:CPA1 family monovalent cation:H+ antiporter